MIESPLPDLRDPQHPTRRHLPVATAAHTAYREQHRIPGIRISKDLRPRRLTSTAGGITFPSRCEQKLPTARRCQFRHRLPTLMAKVVRAPVWSSSRHSGAWSETGVYSRFRTIELMDQSCEFRACSS